VWAERNDQIDREGGKGDADEAAHDREKHNFCDQLPHQPQSRRS
jgi:hypothetical protein